METYLHDDNTPLLIKAALAHAQFETIHRFLDGNGRLGRSLVTLLFCADGALEHPLLYLSLYFKTHRSTDYDLLQRVRTDGTWEEWVRFFLTAVMEVATTAVLSAKAILTMFEEHRQLVQAAHAPGSTLRILNALERSPVATSKTLAPKAQCSQPTANSALKRLIDLGLVEEVTKRERDRVYVYRAYVDLLSTGTNTLPT